MTRSRVLVLLIICKDFLANGLFTWEAWDEFKTRMNGPRSLPPFPFIQPFKLHLLGGWGEYEKEWGTVKKRIVRHLRKREIFWNNGSVQLQTQSSNVLLLNYDNRKHKLNVQKIFRKIEIQERNIILKINLRSNCFESDVSIVGDWYSIISGWSVGIGCRRGWDEVNVTEDLTVTSVTTSLNIVDKRIRWHKKNSARSFN